MPGRAVVLSPLPPVSGAESVMKTTRATHGGAEGGRAK